MPSYENFRSPSPKNQHEEVPVLVEQRREEQYGVNEHGGSEHPLTEQPVLVDGSIRGLECAHLALSTFDETASFQECFFSTDSGNIYALFKLPSGELYLADARSNVGKGDQMRGSRVAAADLQQGTLEVGRSLRLANSQTTTIKQIIVVTDTRFTTGEPDAAQAREIAQEHTDGRTSSIRRQFRDAVYSGS